MKKLLPFCLIAVASGLGANQVLADHRHVDQGHTETVCHETGHHSHGSHHYTGRHDYHGDNHHSSHHSSHHSNQATYTYYSRRPTYSYSYHHYERPQRYHNSRHYDRSSTRVRVNHGLNGNLNLRF